MKKLNRVQLRQLIKESFENMDYNPSDDMMRGLSLSKTKLGARGILEDLAKRIYYAAYRVGIKNGEERGRRNPEGKLNLDKIGLTPSPLEVNREVEQFVNNALKLLENERVIAVGSEPQLSSGDTSAE